MLNLDLQEQLRLLYKLQQIDMEILAFHQKLKSVPPKIQELEESLHVHREKLQKKQGQLAEAETEQRSGTGELEMKQARRGRYQAQLRDVKTNKEYQALDKEISFLEMEEAEMEDEILSVMLRIDQLKEELVQQQKAFDAERVKNNKQKAQYDQEAEVLKAEIAAWQGKRREFLPKIDQSLMGQYQERFQRQRSGLVSLVVDNACGSCHLTIPPQTIQEARKYEQFIRCGSCKRILYIPTPPPDDASSD